eukprot:28426-Prorocentrum_minimum.AAC.1
MDLRTPPNRPPDPLQRTFEGLHEDVREVEVEADAGRQVIPEHTPLLHHRHESPHALQLPARRGSGGGQEGVRRGSGG